MNAALEIVFLAAIGWLVYLAASWLLRHRPRNPVETDAEDAALPEEGGYAVGDGVSFPNSRDTRR